MTLRGRCQGYLLSKQQNQYSDTMPTTVADHGPAPVEFPNGVSGESLYSVVREKRHKLMKQLENNLAEYVLPTVQVFSVASGPYLGKSHKEGGQLECRNISLT